MSRPISIEVESRNVLFIFPSKLRSRDFRSNYTENCSSIIRVVTLVWTTFGPTRLCVCDDNNNNNTNIIVVGVIYVGRWCNNERFTTV